MEKSNKPELREIGDFLREGPGKRFIEPRILFLLVKEPMHGYEIIQRMDEIELPGPVPDTGGVYRKLREMESEGLVVSQWMSEGAGPRKRVYEITCEGRERMAGWLAAMKVRIRMLESFVDMGERELE